MPYIGPKPLDVLVSQDVDGNKIVLQTTDLFKVFGSGAVDVTLSIMEIT